MLPERGPADERPVTMVDGRSRLADRIDELILRLEVWRERPVVLRALVVLGLGLCGLGWWLARPGDRPPVEDLIPLAGAPEPSGGAAGTAATPADDAAGAEGAGSGRIGSVAAVGSGPAGPAEVAGGADEPVDDSPGDELVVHVAGAVHRPGLVRLPPGSRIADAIARAGGPIPAADVHRLNLAAPAADGMRIAVPEIDDEPGEPLVVLAAPSGGGADEPPAGASPSTATPIDLNTASERELESLPGVGPATAAAIVAWRTEHGGFLVVDDLLSVPGIGPVKLAALADLVTV